MTLSLPAKALFSVVSFTAFFWLASPAVQAQEEGFPVWTTAEIEGQRNATVQARLDSAAIQLELLGNAGQLLKRVDKVEELLVSYQEFALSNRLAIATPALEKARRLDEIEYELSQLEIAVFGQNFFGEESVELPLDEN